MVAVKTVLIADDTAFVRDRFRTALEGAGHRAVTVRTGQELLATLADPLGWRPLFAFGVAPAALALFISGTCRSRRAG